MKETGYVLLKSGALTAEDFVNGGKHQVTHMPPTKAKQDYMDFMQAFVAEKAKVLVDIIHKHGKQAYVFYDDSWVGMEPCGERFQSVGLSGWGSSFWARPGFSTMLHRRRTRRRASTTAGWSAFRSA